MSPRCVGAVGQLKRVWNHCSSLWTYIGTGRWTEKHQIPFGFEVKLESLLSEYVSPLGIRSLHLKMKLTQSAKMEKTRTLFSQEKSETSEISTRPSLKGFHDHPFVFSHRASSRSFSPLLRPEKGRVNSVSAIVVYMYYGVFLGGKYIWYKMCFLLLESEQLMCDEYSHCWEKNMFNIFLIYAPHIWIRHVFYLFILISNWIHMCWTPPVISEHNNVV